MIWVKNVQKRWEELPTGQIKFEGVTYPGLTLINKKVTFDSKRWFHFWKMIINEIKFLKLDYYQIQDIRTLYVHDFLSYYGLQQMSHRHQEINEISNELEFALNMAYSNYRDSRTGFWGFIAGIFANKVFNKLSIPNLPFIK